MTDQNGYNVGSDARLTILSNGLPLAATILTNFESRQMTTSITSKGSDGVSRHRDLEEGWEGSADFDRADGVVDDFFAAKEAGRYAGQQPPVVTLSQTINNPDGSVSKYRYDGVSMKLDSAGSYKGDAKVEQKISWRASRRIKVQ